MKFYSPKTYNHSSALGGGSTLLRISSLILLIFFISQSVTVVASASDGKIYVDDTASVINEETEEYISTYADALCRLTGAQITVATVKSLGGEAIDRYAERYFLEHKIGDKNKDNGVLLLMATEEDNYWLTKGGGLENSLSVTVLRTMLDTALEPHFAKGEYSEGARELFDILYGKLCAVYGVSPNPSSDSASPIPDTAESDIKDAGNGRGAMPYVLISLLTVAIVAVVILLVRAIRSPVVDTGKVRRAGVNARRSTDGYAHAPGKGDAKRAPRTPDPARASQTGKTVEAQSASDIHRALLAQRAAAQRAQARSASRAASSSPAGDAFRYRSELEPSRNHPVSPRSRSDGKRNGGRG